MNLRGKKKNTFEAYSYNDELSKADRGGQPFHTFIRLEYRQTDDWAGKTECQGAKGSERGCHDGKERGRERERERMEKQHVNSTHPGLEMVGWLIRGMRDERGSRSSR